MITGSAPISPTRKGAESLKCRLSSDPSSGLQQFLIARILEAQSVCVFLRFASLSQVLRGRGKAVIPRGINVYVMVWDIQTQHA
jgi:hypothetical protein